MPQPVANERSSKGERRRSGRLSFDCPVEARWQEIDGTIVRENGQATEVSGTGGLLQMKTYPAVGTRIELTNSHSHQSLQARVVGIRRGSEGQVRGAAVEFLVPGETFWGVNLQLKKTCTELVKLEFAIRSGGINPRILIEFREAVDHIRRTAWTVQEWQERQLQQDSPHTLLPLLAAERIRRATDLCNAISRDSRARELTRETVGIDEFMRAIESVRQSLLDLFSAAKADKDSPAT